MARPRKGALDDAYDKIQINDFSGGITTAVGPLALGPNQFAAGMNIIPLPGWCLFRGGWDVYSTVPAASDAAFPFKDGDGNWHFAVWAGGTLYDCVNGGAGIVEADCYTAGQDIGYVCDDGILYWSTGQPNPVPLRYWQPTTGARGEVTGNLVPAGAVNPPASSFLFMYAGSIVALAPTWGSPLTADIYQPTIMCWSDTNDPNTWIATNSQAVGSRNGGTLIYGRQFGVSDTGISPTKTILVFRDDLGVYAYTGALGELQESLLNCEIGMKDRHSAQWLPTRNQLGAIVWLGTDGQFWRTDGVTCWPISVETILPTLVIQYDNTLATSSNPRFYSGYNQQWQYYWCTIGDVQFVYRWVTEAWTLFQGWPIGPSFLAEDVNGRPAQFVASSTTIEVDPFVINESEIGGMDVLSETPGPITVYVLAQVAKLGDDDFGEMPDVYWKSPVLHGGDFNLFKKFHWAAIATLDTGVLYNVVGQSIRRSDGEVFTTKTIELQAPANSGPPFIVEESVLDGDDVLTDPIVAALGSSTPVTLQGRLAVEIEPDEWWPDGMNTLLEGTGIQITISRGGGRNAFDLLGLEIFYLSLGYRRGSGTLYNPEALTSADFDPYYGFLNPDDDDEADA